MTDERKAQLTAFIEEVKALRTKLDEGLAKDAHDVYDALTETEPELDDDGDEIADPDFDEVDAATDNFTEALTSLDSAVEYLEEILYY